MAHNLYKKLLMSSSCAILAGAMLFALPDAQAKAESRGSKAIGGFSKLLEQYYEKTGGEKTGEGLSLLSVAIDIPDNIAVAANIRDYVNIRQGAGTGYGVVGYLPKDGVCYVESIENGWAKISSGDVNGYISVDYLSTGAEGKKRARELVSLKATVNAGTVNFRSTPDTSVSSNILAEVNAGEVLEVIEDNVITRDSAAESWTKVYVDDMEGYVARQFVTVEYDWIKAVSIFSETARNSVSGISAIRTALIVEAQKHLGLKYVWGGNSLTTGADCSGFCLAVYRACGISTSNLPRASYDICASAAGRTVSYDEAKPGDLVFYASSSGHVNHVAMYMGNGQIIHEAGRAYGCRISNINYRKVYKIKNFLD